MGYYPQEPYFKYLEKYNREEYLKASIVEREQMIEDVFNIYRKVNEYPMMHFTHQDSLDEIIKCYNKDIDESLDFLDLRFNQGSSLCRFLFPNIRNVTQAGDKRTLNKKFKDDHMLKRAIEFCLKFKKTKCPVRTSCIKDGLEMLGGGVASNFKPMSAKFIYEKFTPEGGTVYDFASGFGGRMLGASTSKKNFKYIGTDPNTKTFNNQIKLKNLIVEALPHAHIEIHNIPSEDLTLPDESVDFAFSSPPYFNLEEYSDEETQSYHKFPVYKQWLEGYVRPTMTKVFSALKKDANMVVNIADFNYKGKTIHIVDDWVSIAQEEGFTLIGSLGMALQVRRGVGHCEDNLKTKKESMFCFKK